MRGKARAFPLALAAVAVISGALWLGAPAHGQQAGQYVSPTAGFTVQFPLGWEQRPLDGGGIIALSPQEGPSDHFRENVNVVFEPLPVQMTSEQYAAANLQNMARSLGSFHLVEQGSGPVGVRPARWVVYGHTMGQPLMVLAYFVVADGRGYVVTCTGSPAQFARWRPVFVQIANTFRV